MAMIKMFDIDSDDPYPEMDAGILSHKYAVEEWEKRNPGKSPPQPDDMKPPHGR